SKAALADDGSLIVVGQDHFGAARVIRLNTHGRIDRTFGKNGLTKFFVGVLGLGVTHDGDVLMGANDSGNFIEIRLDGDGVRTDSGISTGLGVLASFESAVLEPDGKMIFGGITREETEILGRFDVDGRLDPSFGKKGLEYVDPNGKLFTFYDSVIQ